MKKHSSFYRPVILASIFFTMPAPAQTPPDAGRALQELKRPIEPPKPSPKIRIESPQNQDLAEGGVQATVQSISITGNSIFSAAQLLQKLSDAIGKQYDLAGMRNLANRISDYYHEQGYPFARAYLPAQTMQNGQLRIEVVEGKYGQIKAIGNKELTSRAQDFLHPLHSGEVIKSQKLERTTLILDDQPGIHAAPLIRPGQELGTGDLDVRVEREPRFSGDVGLDNNGNRYSGEFRGSANLQFDSPFLFGDQFIVRGLVTSENMWLGSLSYSLPIGSSGLRGQIGYAHTTYELGKEFSNLDATGYAKVSTLGLTYPLLRSQKANTTLGLSLQHKDLQNRYDSTSTLEEKSSDSAPVSIQFDVRDAFGGGAITYGAVTWTYGNLDLDAGLETADRTTAHTQGYFNKLNFDVARIQALPANFSAYGRLSGQWADKNLDSSEDFGLGGPQGIRAYPVGEAYGDEGWLAQIELRYTRAAFSPYIFYDAGGVKINANPWTSGNNRRTIAGAGFGMRYQQGNWNAGLAFAWRTEGGPPQSDSQDRRPQTWATLSYKL